MSKPICFLDVDGVINACPPIPGEKVFAVTVNGLRYPICIPSGTEERIAKLSEHFEMVWATTWREKAHPNFAEHLGLDPEEPCPHIEFIHYKLPSIVEHAVENHLREAILRPWVWIDDNAQREIALLGIAPDEKRALAIAPELSVGLTDEHVERALEFCEQVNRNHEYLR